MLFRGFDAVVEHLSQFSLRMIADHFHRSNGVNMCAYLAADVAMIEFGALLRAQLAFHSLQAMFTDFTMQVHHFAVSHGASSARFDGGSLIVWLLLLRLFGNWRLFAWHA